MMKKKTKKNKAIISEMHPVLYCLEYFSTDIEENSYKTLIILRKLHRLELSELMKIK